MASRTGTRLSQTDRPMKKAMTRRIRTWASLYQGPEIASSLRSSQ
ncbi:MAG: hypothetical protein NTV79_06075 [Candidatus Aureabacteria bacterium]|nr:hypothetical protein [Candidatus Auribacterota bacterium]